VSWTRRAPVIDSTTAQTGWRWTSSIRAGERFQRVGVGRDSELIEVLTVIAQQADVEALAELPRDIVNS
jgi:hypothetical protein